MKRHFKRRRLIDIADAMNVVKDVDYIFDNFVGGGNWWQWKITLVSFWSIQSDTLVLLVFKIAILGLFFVSSVFFKQTMQILQQINMKNVR